MKEIVEDTLLFAFPDGWMVEKYDIKKGEEGFDGRFAGKRWNCCEAQNRVDIIAHDGQRLYLIEVKDFRGKQQDFENKLDSANPKCLWRHTCQKLRDTIMALLAAYRSQDRDMGRYAAKLFDGHAATVDAILFIDHDAAKHRTVTGYFSPETLRRSIEKQIKPLTFDVNVLTRQNMPAGHPWSVRDVAPAAPSAGS
ncbi:hypothetical protein [Azospirillum largimobile]